MRRSQRALVGLTRPWRLTMILLLALAVSVGLAATTLAQEEPSYPVIITYSERPGASDVSRIWRQGGRVKHIFHLIPAISADVPAPAIDPLRRNPWVVAVEPDTEVRALVQQLPWGVDRIDAELVHGYNQGSGIKVAVIDTGIDLAHADLAVQGHVTFVSGTTTGDDDQGHGTHVAGTIAALDNDIGVVGVAPLASVYAVKVLSASGSGSWSSVIQGIEWSVDNGMDVVNMSLGASSAPSAVERAVNNAFDAGLLLVAAAGNSGNSFGIGDNVTFPARYDAVIAVTATDQADQRASFSSTGPDVELAAPGVGILSTQKDGGYATFNGTSMASPHAAGVAALLWANGTLADLNGDGAVNNKDVRLLLQQTADDLGAAGRDPHYGYGLADADEAAPEPEANQPPVADAGGPYSGTEDEPVAFDGTGSSDPDGDSLVNTWDFGDGATGTGPIPTHAYGAGGEYTVTLTVFDRRGGVASDITTATITEVDDPPVADAGPDQTVPLGQEVTLDGSASFDPDGSITAYDWDLGDSTTKSGAVMTHTYAAADTYTATLTVTSDGGATATDSATITVLPGGQQVMHVEAIDMQLVARFGGWRTSARATVQVFDNLGNPVDGVLVQGHWEQATTDTDQGTTDPSGKVTLESNALRKPPPGTTFVFVVDSLTRDGWTHDQNADKETQDSVTA